jgi:sugar phosphate isomerase/epimerase
MKLGLVSAILPELSLEQVLQFASEAGFDCVELMCWPVGKAERRYAGVTHLDVTSFTETQARQTLGLTASAGINISALGYYPNWPRFLEIWPGLVQFAEQNSVCIGIENCPMYFSKDEWPSGKNLAVSPAIWRRMFAEIPSWHWGLNYDPSHLVWQQMDYLKPLKEFANRVVHVHAKDVRVDREKLDDVGILATPLEYHLPKLPGLGDIDWGRFFSILGDTGYDGAVCIEIEDRAYERNLETRKAALRQSVRYLRQYCNK